LLPALPTLPRLFIRLSGVPSFFSFGVFSVFLFMFSSILFCVGVRVVVMVASVRGIGGSLGVFAVVSRSAVSRSAGQRQAASVPVAVSSGRSWAALAKSLK
jgi:hypothetical protein